MAGRELKLHRELSDDCRTLDHRGCGHVGSAGGLRAQYVSVCGCACHRECPALVVAPTDGSSACTCYDTRDRRQADVATAGIKARRRRGVIRGGTPDDGWETSVGFLIGAAIAVGLFVAFVILAFVSSGASRVICVVAAVVLGLYVGWTLLLLGFVRLVARIARRAKA